MGLAFYMRAGSSASTQKYTVLLIIIMLNLVLFDVYPKFVYVLGFFPVVMVDVSNFLVVP